MVSFFLSVAYYNDRIFFETISQSANLETIKMKLWEQISGNMVLGAYNQIPEWQLKLGPRDRGPVLVILDDVWSLSQLEDLVFKFPGCKTLVVSRFKFPTLVSRTYEMQLLDGRKLYLSSAVLPSIRRVFRRLLRRDWLGRSLQSAEAFL